MPTTNIFFQIYFSEFIEALVRCAYHKKKHQLEEEPDEEGGGMSPTTVVRQLDIILNSIEGSLKRSSSIKK